MSGSWTPKRNASFDPSTPGLSRVESLVLARVDGALTATDLADMIGVRADEVHAALTSLKERGALANDEANAVEVSSLAADTGTEADESRNYRKVYETIFRPRSREQRIEAAQTEVGDRLLALTFDAEPVVVRAVLANQEAGLAHARLVATHHRNPVGLEALVARAEFARDSQTQRMLLRNPQLSEPLLRRLLTPRRLVEIYKVTNDRDVAEHTRVRARALLRTKFTSAPPEERVELVWTTEGRCLPSLVGCTFDGRTTALLCAKTFTSAIMVQNFARFSATPPLLLAHLLKQPFVKRQTHLKQLLLHHPNTPADAKRNA